MRIWHREYTLDELNRNGADTLTRHIGIEIIEIGADFLRGTMPVDERTKQPAGILHGGSSVALAETLGSMAANMCVDRDTTLCVGLDINANHVRAARDGVVTGTARPLHLGGGTQVWEIRIENAGGKLVCISRLTMAVLDRAKFQNR